MAATVKIKIYRNVTLCSVARGLHIVKGIWILLIEFKQASK